MFITKANSKEHIHSNPRSTLLQLQMVPYFFQTRNIQRNIHAVNLFSMAASSLIFNSSLSFNFSHTVISFKPQNLKPQFPFSSAISLYHLPLSLVSFQDAQNPLQHETLQKSEPNASRLNHSARLFVGNLPYSLPSSQLAQRFEEAGNVVSSEVCEFFSFFLFLETLFDFGCFIRRFEVFGFWGVLVIIV